MNYVNKTEKVESISIAVVSYNAEDTIISTLDSIVNQSFNIKNIELVISDDNSMDKTVSLIKEWLGYNKEKFLDVVLIESNINRGVSKNVNLAWKACSCKWIKSIAGDDLLLNNCIFDNVEYVNKNPNIKVLFSRMVMFSDIDGYDLRVLPDSCRLGFFNKSPQDQFNTLLRESFNIAPSSFLNNKELAKVGYADERFELMEDLPLWLKFTDSGITLDFMDTLTVKYRYSDSLSNSISRFVNVDFIRQRIEVYKILVIPRMTFKDCLLIYDELLNLYAKLVIAKITNNKNNPLTHILFKLVCLFRPVWYKSQFDKLFNR